MCVWAFCESGRWSEATRSDRPGCVYVFIVCVLEFGGTFWRFSMEGTDGWHFRLAFCFATLHSMMRQTNEEIRDEKLSLRSIA